MNSGGICYLTGAGPGDPALMTLRAMEILQSADIVIYDNLISESVLSLAPSYAQKIYAGKRAGRHEMKQPDINRLILEQVRAGKTVLRLKGGDPFTFGRGGEEAEALTQAGLRFEVVPGITSGIAAPAYAGIPLTHRDYSGLVVFVTGHECPKESGEADWKLLAQIDGTLVIYMGVRNLPNISKNLIGFGKDPKTPAAFVQWGTTAKQRSIVATLESLPEAVARQKLGAPAIIVVGAVAAMGDKLQWFRPGPLAGKRCVVTRTREQNSRLRGLLQALGAEVTELPLIEIRSNPRARIPENLPEKFDWLLFTSANGVEHFLRLWLEGHDIRGLGPVKIAAVGPATAQALGRYGLKTDFVPRTHTAQALVKEWPDRRGSGTVLHICGDNAEPLPFPKSAGGWKAERLLVYRTIEAANARERFLEIFEPGLPDWVVFCSASAVKHFSKLAGNTWPKGLRAASIGPVTSEAIKAAGGTVDLQASSSRLEVLVEELKAASV